LGHAWQIRHDISRVCKAGRIKNVQK